MVDFLVLGSERDLGADHMDHLRDLSASADQPEVQGKEVLLCVESCEDIESEEVNIVYEETTGGACGLFLCGMVRP